MIGILDAWKASRGRRGPTTARKNMCIPEISSQRVGAQCLTAAGNCVCDCLTWLEPIVYVVTESGTVGL